MKRHVKALSLVLALILAVLCAVPGLSAEPDPAADETPAASEEPIASEEPVEAPPEQTVTYPDVTGTEWYADAVCAVTEKGLMSGVEHGLFAPHREVNRATIVIVLWRMEGQPQSTAVEPFPDTESWYAEAADWAKSVGIATGYGGSTPGYHAGDFGGRDPLTREQLAVFLYRYAQYKGEPIAKGMLGLFSDSFNVSKWATDAVRHAVGMGILQGGDGNRLDPKGVASRAQLAVMLERMLTPAAG